MLLTFYFILSLQGYPVSTPGPSQATDVTKIITFLNEIRIKKNMNSEQNKVYDELIIKIKQIERYQQKIMYTIILLRKFIRVICLLELKSPTFFNKEEWSNFKNLFFMSTTKISKTKLKQAATVAKISSILSNSIISKIFLQTEKKEFGNI